MNEKLKKIQVFAMDVDGTLTDGKIYMGQDGEMMKAFDVKDGLGLKLLLNQGIIPVIITGRTSRIVMNRCREIGITEICQGIQDKGEALRQVSQKYRIPLEEIAYIGDDINDLPAIRLAGVSFAPADCGKQILPYIDILLTKKAGDCPVREAIDMILEAQSSSAEELFFL